MSVHTETRNGVHIVSFCGCLLCDSGSLEETLRQLAHEGAHILLDLGEIDHLNSRTIGLLVAIHRAAASQGGSFSICNLNSKSMKLLQALKLHSILRVFDTELMALQAIAGHSKPVPHGTGASSPPFA